MLVEYGQQVFKFKILVLFRMIGTSLRLRDAVGYNLAILINSCRLRVSLF